MLFYEPVEYLDKGLSNLNASRNQADNLNVWVRQEREQGRDNLCLSLKGNPQELGLPWWKMKKWSHFSSGRFFATPGIVACQAPLSMGFSRQEYWSGLQFPSPGDLFGPSIKPGSLALHADFLSSELLVQGDSLLSGGSDTGSIPGWRRSPGEGNDNALQYSCLENFLDKGAWRATVHRIAKSQTQVSD